MRQTVKGARLHQIVVREDLVWPHDLIHGCKDLCGEIGRGEIGSDPSDFPALCYARSLHQRDAVYPDAKRITGTLRNPGIVDAGAKGELES